jgi:hypothetical protein
MFLVFEINCIMVLIVFLFLMSVYNSQFVEILKIEMIPGPDGMSGFANVNFRFDFRVNLATNEIEIFVPKPLENSITKYVINSQGFFSQNVAGRQLPPGEGRPPVSEIFKFGYIQIFEENSIVAIDYSRMSGPRIFF